MEFPATSPFAVLKFGLVPRKPTERFFRAKFQRGSIVMNKGRVFLYCFLQIAAFKKYQSCKNLKQFDIFEFSFILGILGINPRTP